MLYFIPVLLMTKMKRVAASICDDGILSLDSSGGIAGGSLTPYQPACNITMAANDAGVIVVAAIA